jgi:hypothetical protein
MRCHRAGREGFRFDIRDGFDGFGLRLRYVHEFLIARVFRGSAGQVQGNLPKNPPLSTYSVFPWGIVSRKTKKSPKFLETSKLCSTGSWKLLVGCCIRKTLRPNLSWIVRQNLEAQERSHKALEFPTIPIQLKHSSALRSRQALLEQEHFIMMFRIV